MANSGVLGGGGYQGRYLEYAFSLVSQDVQTGRSRIYERVTVVGGSSSYYYHYKDYCDAGGKVLVNSNARTKRYKGDLYNGYRTIQHDANGNASFSAHIIAAIYSSSINEDLTMSWSLPNIPRQAKITNSPTSFNDEENPWFDYSNPANWQLKAWLEPNPNGPHLCQRTFRGTGGKYTWDLTEAERKQLRQACKGNSCKIRIGLYSNGETWASYHDRTFTIKDPNPTAGNATWKSTNLTDLTLSDAIVKGYSNVSVTVEKATPVKEAAIKQYKVIIGDKVASSVEPGVFNFDNVSESIIRVFVEDSRGNTVEKILNIQTVFDYTAPVFTSLSLERTKGGIGTNTVLTFSGNWWNRAFNKASNSINFQYFYKKQGSSSEWIQGSANINPSSFTGDKFENSAEIAGDLGAHGFNAGENFDIKIIATDRITNTEKSMILTSGIPNMAVHHNGVAFGGFYNEEIGGKIQISGYRVPLTYIISGSKVFNVNDNLFVTHTFDEVKQMFYDKYRIEIDDIQKIGVSYGNGHVNATWTGVTGFGCQDMGDTWRFIAYLSATVNGSFRLNYTYTYVVEESEVTE